MANYSREDMEKQGNAAVGVAGTLLLGLAAVIGQAVVESGKKQDANNRLLKINQQITVKNQQINDLRSKFLGSVFYADDISRLERERDELMRQR